MISLHPSEHNPVGDETEFLQSILPRVGIIVLRD